MSMTIRKLILMGAVSLTALAGTAQAQNGLRGEYYTWPSDLGCPPDRAQVFKPENLAGFGLDSTINFGNPFTLPGTSSDYFAARWTGSVTVPTAGNYCFTTRSDDGVRLWIKDGAIDPATDTPGIDRWENRGESGDDPPVCLDMAANKPYNLVLEYAQCSSGSAVRLRYSAPGAVASDLVPPSLLSPPPASDKVAPGTVTGLALTNVGSDTVTLGFKATGDDADTGTAFSYDLRYSTLPITPENFYLAKSVVAPTPEVAGTTQSLDITGLQPIETYYFAVRAIDEDLNAGPLSEVVTTTTLAADDTQGRVSGRVLDRNGNPLPGTKVSVKVGDTDAVVLTADANGRFSGLVGAGTATVNIDITEASVKAVDPAGKTVTVVGGKAASVDLTGVIIPTLTLVKENGFHWLIYLDPSVDPFADFSAVNADESKFHAWEVTLANGNWTEYLNSVGVANANMDGWLRLHLTLPADWGTDFRGPLRFHGFNFNAADESFFNGTSIGETGKLTKDDGGPIRVADDIRDYLVPENIVNWTGDNIIAVHGWHDAGSGGFTQARPQLTVTTFTVPKNVLGDLNGDGKVNIADATMALQFAVGNGTPTAAQITAGDVVGGDGKIGIPDVTKILQAAIGAINL